MTSSFMERDHATKMVVNRASLATKENTIRYGMMAQPLPPATIVTAVPAPRSSDALGVALRDAFARPRATPPELSALLAALDTPTCAERH